MSRIETQREHGDFDTIKFFFRYVLLTENQKSEIENEFKGTNSEIESKLSKSNGYVLSLDINESVDSDRIKKINDRLKIPEANFGVWVSLISNYDHSGLSFPKHVVDLIRIVGGHVDVSTIMISEDE